MAWLKRSAIAARPKNDRKKKKRRSNIEFLEARDVPAVTVSLAGGVLNITGSAGNDTIAVRYANKRITVSGSSASFAAAKVSVISVNGKAGNDTVMLTGMKTTAWAGAISVKNTGGLDTVRTVNGQAAFLGSGQTLAVSKKGVSTIGGQALDWYDQAIRDVALRGLLRNSAADGLDRSEVLALFNQVKSDGVVNANEFQDLQVVASSPSMFGSATHLVDLTRNVVQGNAANATYQGATLGNLTSGSTGTKLDLLVNKWFLGLDRPNASYTGLTVTYTAAAGSLFGVGGPVYSDVRQGAVGDCYFVATLAETALKDPSAIQNMFIVNGDGTYTVRFYQGGASRYVTVDSYLPTYSGGTFLYANMGGQANNANNVLWVALAEKAYVQMNEAGWLRPAGWGGGVNAYAAIAGGLLSEAAAHVANRPGVDYTVNGAADAGSLAAAIAAGKMIGFATTSAPSNPQIVESHQYVLVAYNSGTQTVTLFNPWGINNGTSKPGLVDLTLTQLIGSFDYWTIA